MHLLLVRQPANLLFPVVERLNDPERSEHRYLPSLNDQNMMSHAQ